MSKNIEDKDSFLELCNKELQNQPEYEEGMEIIGVPNGTSGTDLSGYNWKGPSEIMPGLVSKVVKKLKKQHNL